MALLPETELLKPYIKKAGGYVKSLLSSHYVKMDDEKTLQAAFDILSNTLTTKLPLTIPFTLPSMSTSTPNTNVIIPLNNTLNNTDYFAFAYPQENFSYNTAKHLGLSIVEKTTSTVHLRIWNESNQTIVSSHWILLIIPQSSSD